ncbi:hypothetical protein LTR56_002433 [Elasticomyces elasticus]|nr:hypothetical protein LTR56_002433 [Elasticomyces elasticus]KAK5753733.1 hypothetical protein LTS12_016148 [Elasticomyces elasticus]
MFWTRESKSGSTLPRLERGRWRGGDCAAKDSNESARSKKKAKEPQSTDNSSNKKAYEPQRTHNPTNKKQSASTRKGDNSLITDTINTTKANTTTNSKQKAGTKQSTSPLNTITSFFSAEPKGVPKTIPVVDTPDLDDDSDSGASEPINHKKTRSDARKKQNVTKSRNTSHKSKTKLLATKDTLDATLEDPNTTSSTKTSGSKEIPDSDDLGSLLEKKLTEAEKLVASAAGVNFVSQKVQETEPTPLYRIDKDAFPFRSSELRARSGTSKPPNDNTDIVRAWTPTNANEALEAPEMPAGKSKGSFTFEDVQDHELSRLQTHRPRIWLGSRTTSTRRLGREGPTGPSHQSTKPCRPASGQPQNVGGWA